MNHVAKDRQLVQLGEWGKFRSNVYRIMRRPYLVTALSSYVAVIMLVVLYMSKPETFRSEMELVLPGTGSSNSVSLNDVGQVVSQTSTPFAGGGFNPRVNYKEMLSSRGVIATAAEKMGLTVGQFGEGKVKLTEQTSIIEVSITGDSPKQAQTKAWELYLALQNELDNLRADEVTRRDASIKNVLAKYREKVTAARNNIVDFQQRSMLVSTEQLNMLISSHSQKNAASMNAKAELADLTHYVHQLSLDVGLSPALAGQALKLGTDAEYLGYLAEMDQSAAKLSEYRSRWGQKHPKVVTEDLRFVEAKNALFTRAQELVGVKAKEVFGVLSIKSSPKRAQLFADLINAYAKQQGLKAKQTELDRSVLHLADQIKICTREHAELDRLEREFDLAEAVYTSAAARLEASKADIFASYPVVQLLTTPSFPLIAASPIPAIGILAAVVGIVFITLALVVVWQRNSLLNLVLKKD